MTDQIIAAELHRDPDGSVYAIKFDGVTYLKARRINEQQSHVGVLHDRPEPMEPPPADNSWVEMEHIGWPDPDGWTARVWRRLARKGYL